VVGGGGARKMERHKRGDSNEEWARGCNGGGRGQMEMRGNRRA